MATGRINKKVLDHIAQINKEAKQIELSKNEDIRKHISKHACQEHANDHSRCRSGRVCVHRNYS